MESIQNTIKSHFSVSISYILDLLEQHNLAAAADAEARSSLERANQELSWARDSALNDGTGEEPEWAWKEFYTARDAALQAEEAFSLVSERRLEVTECGRVRTAEYDQHDQYDPAIATIAAEKLYDTFDLSEVEGVKDAPIWEREAFIERLVDEMEIDEARCAMCLEEDASFLGEELWCSDATLNDLVEGSGSREDALASIAHYLEDLEESITSQDWRWGAYTASDLCEVVGDYFTDCVYHTF